VPTATADLVHDLLAPLTVGQIMTADSPADLLERVGCQVPIWQDAADDRQFGVVHAPGIGWMTVACIPDRVVVGAPASARGWQGDPASRLALLVRVLTDPLSAPVPIEAELPMAIAAAPLPHRAHLGQGWLAGRVLAILLIRLPERERTVVTGLLTLSHPEVLEALQALSCWQVNVVEPGVTAMAQETIGAAKIRRWPIVWRHVYADRLDALTGAAVGHQYEEALELLYHRFADWDAVADRLVTEWAGDPETYLWRELDRQSLGAPGRGAVFDPFALT
jgi:hypothetical protein